MVRLRRTTIVAGLAAALCMVATSAAFATLDGATAPTVDVRAYGARGDGTHDDTAALRRAMRAVALLGGGTVRLPRGIYRVTHITVPDAVRLAGDGMSRSWIRGGVTVGSHVVLRDLKIGARGHAFRTTAGARSSTFVRCRFRGGGDRSCDHITFKDCKIECNLGKANADHTNLVNNITITENGVPGGAHVDSVSLIRCRVGVSNGVREGCPRIGLEAYTWHGGDFMADHGWSNLLIEDCVFEEMDWYSIDLADHVMADGVTRASGPALITGNTFKGGKRYTVCTESPAGVVFEDNTVYRSPNITVKMGWRDMSAVDCATVFRNNTFLLDVDNGFSLGSPAFWLSGGGNQFTGNTVRGGAARVFELAQFYNGTVTGNTLDVPASSTLFAIDAGCYGNVLAPNNVN